MRIDKYLKVSRLIKRRTVANEVADAGRILVNGKPAKASYAVKEGDVIEITFGNKPVKVRVLAAPSPPPARTWPGRCTKSSKGDFALLRMTAPKALPSGRFFCAAVITARRPGIYIGEKAGADHAGKKDPRRPAR